MGSAFDLFAGIGQTSLADYRGRALSSYHSFYEVMKVNDVRVKKRTAEEINNREFLGNNKDYIGANFLYNHEFYKEFGMKGLFFFWAKLRARRQRV